MGSGRGNLREVSVLDFGARGDNLVGGAPNNGTDDSAAFQAAIAAACGGVFPPANAQSAIVRVPPLPIDPATGFQRRYKASFVVEAAVRLLGAEGASTGRNGASRIVCADGLNRAAIKFANAFQSPNGGDAEGASLEGIQVDGPPLRATVPYSVGLTPAVGDLVKPTTNSLVSNTWLFEVVDVTGPTVGPEPDWRINCHVPDQSLGVRTPGMRIFHGNLVRSSDVTTWGTALFQAVIPAGGANPVVLVGPEPPWDYTFGNNTVDGGVTWLQIGPESYIVDGGVTFRCVAQNGLFATTSVKLTDFLVTGCQNAGVQIYGSDPNIWGSNAQRCVLQDGRVIIPGGGSGIGVYTRGGNGRYLKARGVTVLGSVAAPQGTVTGGGTGGLPAVATANEHGIVDEFFAGGSEWNGCTSENCGGFAFWGAGGTSQAIFSNCNAPFARVRLDQASQWIGPDDGLTFWYVFGIGYNSSAPSATVLKGFKNLYAQPSGLGAFGQVVLGLEPNYAIAVQPQPDGSVQGLTWQSVAPGFWSWTWAGGFPAYSLSTRQVDTYPPGLFWLHQGMIIGSTGLSLTAILFSDLDSYKGSARNGARVLGDAVITGQNVAAGNPWMSVVTTAGFAGAKWVAGFNYTKYVAAPGALSKPGSPLTASTGLGPVFLPLDDGVAGAIEPNFAAAPNPGDIVLDPNSTPANVRLQNQGAQAALSPAIVPTNVNVDYPARGRLRSVGAGGNLVSRYRTDNRILVGSKFSQLTDMAGANNVVQAVNANRPDLLYPGAINGHDLMTCSGTEWLSAAGRVVIGNAGTIVAFVRSVGAAAASAYAFDAADTVVGDSTGAVANGFGLTGVSPDTHVDFPVVGGGLAGKVDMSDGLMHMIVGSSVNGGNVKVYEGQFPDGAGGGPIVAIGFDSIGRGFNAADGFAGDIGEVLIFNVELTQAELALIQDYGAAYWAVAAG